MIIKALIGISLSSGKSPAVVGQIPDQYKLKFAKSKCSGSAIRMFFSQPGQVLSIRQGEKSTRPALAAYWRELEQLATDRFWKEPMLSLDYKE